MEEAGGQVLTQMANYQNLVGRFHDSYPSSKKRGVGATSPNVAIREASGNWNADSWEWDPATFAAKPLHCDQDVLILNKDKTSNSNPHRVHPRGEDEEHVFLKLGSGDSSAKSGTSGETDSEEVQPASKPAKRIRAGSPGGTNHPVCQVDGCNENLSSAKDYHRRHKVCSLHSKAADALVGGQTQRFCQQCSRFHLLTEFDAGKRSCRRRLAGHNRRRRKTLSEEINPPLLVPQNLEKNITDVDIVNLLAMLSQAQRDSHDMTRSFPNSDQLVQLITNVNPNFPETLIPKLNASVPKHAPTRVQNPTDKKTATPPSTRDLLAVLKAASPAPLTHESQSDQTSTDGSESEKSKSSCVNEASHMNLQRGLTKQLPFVGERSTASNAQTGDIELNVIEASPNLPLQLFSSSYDDHQLRIGPSDWNMPSSQSIIPVERAPPVRPVTHDFFALQSSREKLKDANSPNSEVEIPSGCGNVSNQCSTSLQLFGSSTRFGENGSFHGSHDHMEQASTSGSYYSTTTLKPDSQDCTGRIIIKLFDKDPSSLPGSLRTQIYNWLSSSPSDMESYIRPGCILLSLYVSMSPIEWDRLEENLLSYMKSLVHGIDSQFWRTGRFLVHINKQMAVSNEGNIRICTSWRSRSMPVLISASPLAVVSKEETNILLKGRRLLDPSTKIHCTHAAGYCIEKLTPSSFHGLTFDEITLGGFKVEDAKLNRFGRCYIEVEAGSRSASFPIIIADKTICEELNLLEPEIDCTFEDDIPNSISQDGRFESREWALHFLNELGWLFQRKNNGSPSAYSDYSLTRLKFLLIFSVERDFCALVKTLLDILVEMNHCQDGLVKDSFEMLSEVDLLSRAVKRRCQGMVNMLIHFSIVDPTDDSKKYIFLCDKAGPGGFTPLHIAASLPNADAIVNALTSDPLEIGLRSWQSLFDEQGLSPYAYASMRNHQSYNRLVAQKLADRSNDQVSISIDTAEHFSVEKDSKSRRQGIKSCSKCTVVAALGHGPRIPGSRAFLHRSYIHSILVVAAVCVCVCLILRGRINICHGSPFAWDNLDYGAI